jgi:hypothetical protein
MTPLHPSHETRKITVVLPAYIIDALRPRLLGDESITECIKRLVRQEALGDRDEPDPDDDHPSLSARDRNRGLV